MNIRDRNLKADVCVSSKECLMFECYAPHKYQHRSYNETEGSMTSTDKHFSCSTRNYHGCPEHPKLRKE
jgi:hypothetical protein